MKPFTAGSRVQQPRLPGDATGRCTNTRTLRLPVARSFEGDPTKALKEAAANDELIDMLLSAKSQQEVGTSVWHMYSSLCPRVVWQGKVQRPLW